MASWTKRIQNLFGSNRKQEREAPAVDPSMPLTPELVGSMVQGILSTRPDELDCAECFEELDRFADLHLVDKRPEEALPLVQDHLNRCKDCREEFMALLLALRAG